MDVEKGWQSTCKVLLGREIGPLSNYEKYLSKHVSPYRTEKSLISGKEVVVSGEYDTGARFISGDEIIQYEKMAKDARLDINSIKDIDSVVGALGEVFCYSGNDILGKSWNVSQSNKVLDSTDVYRSHEVIFSKNIAYCHIVKYSEHGYGGESVGYHAFHTIKGFEIYESHRVFEGIRVYHSSDCLFTAAMDNCRDCMFSFNLRSKSKCIGNLELAPGKYSELKGKLQDDIAQILEKKRDIVSLPDIIGGAFA
jgi:hypothetical protein